MARAGAKGVGWLAAALTGGPGLEDLFLVPMINTGLLQLFNIDLKSFLGKLEYALRKKQYCMYRDEGIVAVADFHMELTYFCWCYYITDEVNSNEEKMKNLLSLINPFEDDASPKHKKSVGELYDLIEKNLRTNIMHDNKRKLNKYLFDYLTKVNKTNNDLYSKLGSMQND